jgi:hypothetical protein
MSKGHSASTTAEIRKTLLEMCRPFGTIQHWTVEHADGGLYRCCVRLEEPERHRLVAQMLGGELHDDEVHLRIRVRQPPRHRGSDATSSYQ